MIIYNSYINRLILRDLIKYIQVVFNGQHIRFLPIHINMYCINSGLSAAVKRIELHSRGMNLNAEKIERKK